MFGIFTTIREIPLPDLGNVLREALKLSVKVLNAMAKALTVFAEEMGIIETKDPEKLGGTSVFRRKKRALNRKILRPTTNMPRR